MFIKHILLPKVHQEPTLLLFVTTEPLKQRANCYMAAAHDILKRGGCSMHQSWAQRSNRYDPASSASQVQCQSFSGDILYEPMEILSSSGQPFTSFKAFWDRYHSVGTLQCPSFLVLTAPCKSILTLIVEIRLLRAPAARKGIVSSHRIAADEMHHHCILPYSTLICCLPIDPKLNHAISAHKPLR